MRTFLVLFTALFICGCSSLDKIEKEEFIVDLNSVQIHLGEIDLQLDKFMGGLKRESVNIIYFPREDAVCLNFRQDLTTYHQFWNREGRELFLNSLTQYGEDYAERNLENKKPRTTRQIYGNTEGYLTWRTHRFGMIGKANMIVGMGYLFKDRAPYFVIYQNKTESTEQSATQNNMECQPITMYFTRAQAGELAVFFQQHILNDINIQNRLDNLAPATLDIDKEEY